MNSALWCVAMLLVAVSPLLGHVAVRWILLVAGIGLVAGIAITVLRQFAPRRYLPSVLVLTLIIGAVVAGTSHRSLALSWVGSVMVGVFALAAVKSHSNPRH